MAIWSCLMNLGLVFDFSPVFLSTRQIRAWIVTFIEIDQSAFHDELSNRKPDSTVNTEHWLGQTFQNWWFCKVSNNLFSHCLKVKHAGVARADNRLKVQHHNLCSKTGELASCLSVKYWRKSFYRFSTTHLSIKNLSSLDRVGGAAEHKARGHITLLDPLYLKNQGSTPETCGRYMWLADLGLDVLPRGHLSHLNVVWPDLIHFDFRLVKVRVSHKSEERTLWTHPVRHNQKLVPRFHRSRLHLKCVA